jgi:endonuclease IV
VNARFRRPETSEYYLKMFGSHLSIAGGLHKAILSAEKYAMDTVQVFTQSPQSWGMEPVIDRSLTKNIPLDNVSVKSEVLG